MKIDVELDLAGLKNLTTEQAMAVENDKAFWTFAAKEWHRLYSKYVPFDTGVLRDTVVITPGQIEHTSPYAHYQYTGDVYGPNYPFAHNGIVTGYFSPPNRKKSPTGKKLKYKNPLASREWDKKAESTQKDKLISAMQRYVDSGRLKLDDD